MTLFLLILLPFLATPAVFLAARHWTPAATALVPALLFCGFASYGSTVTQLDAIVQYVQWIPSLGISLALRLDGLALIFALLITGIGTAIFLYASAYLPRTWQTPRFFATLNVFMVSMLGAVISDDLLGLIVFWELTSLSSFMLIGYDPTRAECRRSAQQGLLITVAGGLAMLAGVILLGALTGTYRISELLAQGLDARLSASLGTAIVLLIAIGAFSKSAQFPMHSWLANAMVAPTPVSAFLHSATMVKLGVYLLARLNPVLSEIGIWTPLLLTVGSLTMFCATILALRETDLKRILAYTTIVSLGTLITLIGADHPAAAMAMAVFLVVHALYKACLFMVAGIIDHSVGTRDSTILGGLAKAMPITAAIACLASLSMAGIPPLFGFIGKELIYEAALSAPIPHAAFAIAILANACMVVVAGIIALRCFFGSATEVLDRSESTPHDPSVLMWIGPLILALLGLLLGLMPGWIQSLLSSAATSAQGEAVDLQLSLWHGFTPMLALSAVTLAIGTVIYLCWNRLQRRLKAISLIDRWGPDALYDRALEALAKASTWQTALIQTGSLRHYMAMSVGIVAAATLAAAVMNDALALPPLLKSGAGMEQLILPLLLIAASIMVLRSRSFVQGIISAGAVGFGVAVVFLLGGAPDLAFTQFSVEALSVVILLAVIGHMPFRVSDPRSSRQRNRDACIGVMFGLMFIAVLFSVVALPFNEALSDFFREASYPLAHGRNLVNVIIVDFRALDTLGEITVLALAALAAVAVFFSAGGNKPEAPRTGAKQAIIGKTQ
ncbi:hydrogen gas-evolving membrane-bound hydrogenase subunit E [Paracandidimonas soli]|uniref:Multisubunit sodium/proton antiporter MrpA subunit n=2 Tax=Paracandidimonas soli TaxID=1917182 RepID=A0A4V2VQW0_9BURK|nr:hydrogen gas-evolving membrane-bound hydrogenase subunit E [Paracandidimonas soli]TCU96099.1 multisubunit sodium/proton antiporter MrpA subunit [Paracandidimonas soli]